MAFKTKLTMKFLTKIKANLTMINHNHIQNKTHVETKNEIQIGIHNKFLNKSYKTCNENQNKIQNKNGKKINNAIQNKSITKFKTNFNKVQQFLII